MDACFCGWVGTERAAPPMQDQAERKRNQLVSLIRHTLLRREPRAVVYGLFRLMIARRDEDIEFFLSWDPGHFPGS
jgi:hypothetical protein